MKVRLTIAEYLFYCIINESTDHERTKAYASDSKPKLPRGIASQLRDFEAEIRDFEKGRVEASFSFLQAYAAGMGLYIKLDLVRITDTTTWDLLAPWHKQK